MLIRGVQDYLTRCVADQPSREAPRAAGLNPEIDAIEMANTVNGHQVAPLHMGLATRGAPPALTTDPAAQGAVRLAVARRFGRQPTPAEVTSEVASFDGNVTRINAALALRHAELKAAYQQTGQFTREMEAPLLGVRPRDPEAVNPSEATSEAWRDAFTRLVNSIAATPPRVPQ